MFKIIQVLPLFFASCSTSSTFDKPSNVEPSGVYTLDGQYDFDYDVFYLVGSDDLQSLIDCSSTHVRCIYTQYRTIIAPNCGGKFKPYMFRKNKISEFGQAEITIKAEKIMVNIYSYGENILGERYHSLTYYSLNYGVVAVSTMSDESLNNIGKDNGGNISIDESKLYYGDRVVGLFACSA